MSRRRHSAQYESVMRSERWQVVRREALRLAGGRCQRCGQRGALDAHHWRGYGMLGQEQPHDLLMLCRMCHQVAHGQMPRRGGFGCFGLIGLLLALVLVGVALRLAAGG